MNDALYGDNGAPDEPPIDGFTKPERRHRMQRADDRIARDMESWVARLFVHRGKLVALASFVTFLGTSLGWRLVGPTQDLKELDRKFTTKDSIMSARVSRIEDGQSDIKAQLASITESMRFLTYMACQATDKDRRPNTCYVVTRDVP